MTNDADYAQTLLRMLREDCDRLPQQPDRAPVVLWMVEEVRQTAAHLALPRDTVREMLTAASDCRRQALAVQRTTRRRDRGSHAA